MDNITIKVSMVGNVHTTIEISDTNIKETIINVNKAMNEKINFYIGGVIVNIDNVVCVAFFDHTGKNIDLSKYIMANSK